MSTAISRSKSFPELVSQRGASTARNDLGIVDVGSISGSFTSLITTAAISAGLQTQISTNTSVDANQATQIAALSGNYTSLTTTSAISANLQNQITTNTSVDANQASQIASISGSLLALSNTPSTSGKSLNLTFTGSVPAGTFLVLGPAVASVSATQSGPTTYRESPGTFLGPATYNWPNATTISFNDASAIVGGNFAIVSTNCTSLSFPVLTIMANNVALTVPSATTVSLPNWTTAANGFTLNANSLTSWAPPLLDKITSIYSLTLNSVPTLNINTLSSCDAMTISSTSLATMTISGSLSTMLGSLTVSAANLSAFSAPNLTSVGSLVVSDTTQCPLATYNVNGLTNITNGGWKLPNVTGPLTTLAANNLVSISGIGSLFSSVLTANNTSVTSISANALTSLNFTNNSGNAILLGGNGSSFGFTSLTTLSIPNLTSINSPVLLQSFTMIDLANMTSLTTVSFPNLANFAVGSNSNCPFFKCANMGALTTINLGGLVNIDTTGICINLSSGTAALTTLTFGAAGVTKKIGGNIIITSAALTQASVDGVLARLVALDGTGGTTLYTGAKTVTLTGTSSTPSAGGLANKATLVARGITVTTN